MIIVTNNLQRRKPELKKNTKILHSGQTNEMSSLAAA